MSLSCECDFNGEGWFWTDAKETTLISKRRKRCCSCNTLIELNAITVEFNRARFPATEVEEKIYGDDGEITLASRYMCETCGDLFWSLEALGFCIYLGDDMRKLVKEYADLYGKN